MQRHTGEIFDKITRNGPSIHVLDGPKGVGKSATLFQLAAALKQSSNTVVLYIPDRN